MSIENGKLFEHCFWIERDQSSSKDSWKIIEEWCNESCAGQWMIISGAGAGTQAWDNRYLTIKSYSRAAHNSPVENQIYSASSITINVNKILMFEKIEDATAFKLRWM